METGEGDSERLKKIQSMVDEIWAKFDTDGNGHLDKAETYKLALETIAAVQPGMELSEEQFETLFTSIDKDGSGKIVKLEMAHFIKKLLP